ncbi:MAG TPA: hypothetical protein VNA27_07050 [Rubrobacteraceae bacterium]|nr:hypothetical protein [Rubrobacteraceae bacterium]
MRVLVANSPLMYRESLALSIQRARPNFEVLIANPGKLDGQVESLAPHAFVRDDDGVETRSPDGVVCWVGIMIDNHLNARISVDGKISEIHDVSLEEFLAALDETERLISTNAGKENPPSGETIRSS